MAPIEAAGRCRPNCHGPCAVKRRCFSEGESPYPGSLLYHPVAVGTDEEVTNRLELPMSKGRSRRLSERTGRNMRERRAGLETKLADADPAVQGGSVLLQSELEHPAVWVTPIVGDIRRKYVPCGSSGGISAALRSRIASGPPRGLDGPVQPHAYGHASVAVARFLAQSSHRVHRSITPRRYRDSQWSSSFVSVRPHLDEGGARVAKANVVGHLNLKRKGFSPCTVLILSPDFKRDSCRAHESPSASPHVASGCV